MGRNGGSRRAAAYVGAPACGEAGWGGKAGRAACGAGRGRLGWEANHVLDTLQRVTARAHSCLWHDPHSALQPSARLLGKYI